MINIDDTDRQLISLLRDDARSTVAALALKLKVARGTVQNRLARLEREGVIRKYVALIDREKVGKKLMVFCQIALKEHSLAMGEKFVEAIMAIPEVLECHNISGDYDFHLKILVNDMPEYQQFLMQKLGSLENIGSTHSLFVMGEIKNNSVIGV